MSQQEKPGEENAFIARFKNWVISGKGKGAQILAIGAVVIGLNLIAHASNNEAILEKTLNSSMVLLALALPMILLSRNN